MLHHHTNTGNTEPTSIFFVPTLIEKSGPGDAPMKMLDEMGWRRCQGRSTLPPSPLAVAFHRPRDSSSHHFVALLADFSRVWQADSANLLISDRAGRVQLFARVPRRANQMLSPECVCNKANSTLAVSLPLCLSSLVLTPDRHQLRRRLSATL